MWALRGLVHFSDRRERTIRTFIIPFVIYCFMVKPISSPDDFKPHTDVYCFIVHEVAPHVDCGNDEMFAFYAYVSPG